MARCVLADHAQIISSVGRSSNCGDLCNDCLPASLHYLPLEEMLAKKMMLNIFCPLTLQCGSGRVARG
jgi:hypothetical protein